MTLAIGTLAKQQDRLQKQYKDLETNCFKSIASLFLITNNKQDKVRQEPDLGRVAGLSILADVLRPNASVLVKIRTLKP